MPDLKSKGHFGKFDNFFLIIWSLSCDLEQESQTERCGKTKRDEFHSTFLFFFFGVCILVIDEKP